MHNQKGETVHSGIARKAGKNNGKFFSTDAAQDHWKIPPATPVKSVPGPERSDQIDAINGRATGPHGPVSRSPETSRSPAPPKALPRWKACLDAALIFLVSPLLIPLMLLIAFWIKLVSRGPVIFKQQRIGYLGMPFTILKFRTMNLGAQAEVHQDHVRSLMRSNAPMTKMDCKGDPRLIPLGVWMRATALDELPQLINVLRGEMSLVGPRPCTCYEFDQYEPWQRERFNVLPGLTGLWQVSGKNKTTFNQMIKLDIRYARGLCLAKDLKIIVKTFLVLMRQLVEAGVFKWKGAVADKDAGPIQNGTVALSRSAKR